MEDNKNISFKLSTRQIEVARRNLVSVCRFAVKSLIDKACFSNVDDECEEFINFCAVLEQVLLHRIKPHKTWYGGEEGRFFWDYIRTACRRVPQSCILSIDAIENIKSPSAKGRAFIRCALMEKKLSEYVGAALKQPHITRKHYMDGAIMLSDDSNMLCGILLGLNAIDFSFCLKGKNMDLLGPLAIDFTPFLQFHQSVESISSDIQEMRDLSNSSISSSIMSESNTDEATWHNKYRNLEHKYKSVCEQKGYLEELVRLRERQTEEVARDNQNMEMRLQYVEAEAQRDRLQLENVVLELQEQLGRVKSERQMLQQRLSLLLAASQQTGPWPRRVTEFQMTEIAGDGLQAVEITEQHNFSDSTEVSSSRQLQTVQQQDNKSLLSGSSGQFLAKEDTHSMIPLTGSLTDVQMRAVESPLHHSKVGESKKTDGTDRPRATSSQGRESTDRESCSDVDTEYRERPPSQAFPSFSYVDLDASLEKEDPFVPEEKTPEGDKKQERANSNIEDDVPSRKENLSVMESSSSSVEKLDEDEDINNSNTQTLSVDGGEKTDSGNSDFDVLNTDKSSSNGSSIELAEPSDSNKSSSPTPLEDSTEDEYQRIGSDEGQTDSANEDTPDETTQTPTGDDAKDMITTEEHEEHEAEAQETPQAPTAADVEVPPDDDKLIKEEELEPRSRSEQGEAAVDSGSSEGDKDWDLLSDTSGNGHNQHDQDVGGEAAEQ